jgi:hypothetical protein
MDVAKGRPVLMSVMVSELDQPRDPMPNFNTRRGACCERCKVEARTNLSLEPAEQGDDNMSREVRVGRCHEIRPKNRTIHQGNFNPAERAAKGNADEGAQGGQGSTPKPI